MPRPQPLPPWARGFRVAVVGGLLAAAVWATWDYLRDHVRDARLSQVTVVDRQLDLGIDSCNAEKIDIEVNESDDAVRIAVRVTNPAEGDDCRDTPSVRLDQPLGERRLIDGSTGRALRCERETPSRQVCTP
jgi:hypothetical protein